MTKRKGILALLVVVSGLAWSEDIAWTTDVDQAFTSAKAQNRLVMMDVYTEWCTWCDKLDAETYKDPEVVKLSKTFVCLKLDAEKNPGAQALQKRYGFSGYPTILFLEGDGNVVGKLGGFAPAEDFLAAMKNCADTRSKLNEYSAQYNAKDYSNSQEFLELLASLGRVAEAKPVYATIKASLDTEAQCEQALNLAKGLLDAESFDAALPFLDDAEAMGPDSEYSFYARLLRSIALYYVKGKQAALDYLGGLVAEEGLSEEWAEQYKSLAEQMEAAQ